MMENVKLIIAYEEFERRIKGFLDRINSIKDKRINTVEELENFITISTNTLGEIEFFLSNSFNIPENEYYQEFKFENKFVIPNTTGKTQSVKFWLPAEVKKLKDILQGKRRSISSSLKFISVADKIRNEKGFDEEKRLNLSISETQQLLLEKLYELFDDSYYSVMSLLVGNGIKIPRYNFDRDITNELETLGLIDIIGSFDGVSARITGYGAKYVEEYIRSKINLEVEKKSILEVEKNETLEIKQLKLKFKNKLSIGKLEEVFDELPVILRKNKVISDDLVQLSGRFYQLSRRIAKGIISEEQCNLERNRITDAALNLINRIEISEIEK